MFKALIMSLCALLFSLSLLIRPAHSQTLSEQIVSDLVTVGITGAATLSGNIPLAMASGVLSKYISTYGVQGVKFLINKVKAESPQDLGEINIYFVYLIHVKRNLYHSMINLRNNVKSDRIDETLIREIEELEKKMKGECPQGGCAVTGLDETLVNFEFLNVALDAKQSFNVFEYLEAQQVKSTYQYLMLLYMDVILVEQKLLESQYNVLAQQTATLMESLEENVYLSNEEKEYSFQLSLNMVLKWQKQRDERRALLLSALKKPLEELEVENSRLEDEINGYREQNDELKKLLVGF